MIVGKDGSLYVRIGGTDTDWQPSDSNYSDYREYAYAPGGKSGSACRETLRLNRRL